MKKIAMLLLTLALIVPALALAEPPAEPAEATPLETPILITSVGQSADYQMLGALLTKVGVEYEMKNLATSADLGEVKTLMLAVGGSSKGLGAAGIDADQELARVSELIEGAKAAGIRIVALHIGGEARRGELSDKFIVPAIRAADRVIAVAAGDKDGLLTATAGEAGVPIAIVNSITGVGDAVKELFP